MRVLNLLVSRLPFGLIFPFRCHTSGRVNFAIVSRLPNTVYSECGNLRAKTFARLRKSRSVNFTWARNPTIVTAPWHECRKFVRITFTFFTIWSRKKMIFAIIWWSSKKMIKTLQLTKRLLYFFLPQYIKFELYMKTSLRHAYLTRQKVFYECKTCRLARFRIRENARNGCMIAVFFGVNMKFWWLIEIPKISRSSRARVFSMP